SSIFALPSYTEGFPNVILEAMSMGCAVIATNVGAIPEMLAISSDKPCGICVPVKNVEKLTEAITLLISNPQKVEMMGRNGSERVLKYYTFNSIIKQYMSVWQNALTRE